MIDCVVIHGLGWRFTLIAIDLLLLDVTSWRFASQSRSNVVAGRGEVLCCQKGMILSLLLEDLLAIDRKDNKIGISI